MATMNVSLPGLMKAWIETRLKDGRFTNTSDYVRHLIHRDQERMQAIDEGGGPMKRLLLRFRYRTEMKQTLAALFGEGHAVRDTTRSDDTVNARCYGYHLPRSAAGGRPIVRSGRRGNCRASDRSDIQAGSSHPLRSTHSPACRA